MNVFISHIHEEAKLAQVLKNWIESTFAGQINVFVSSDRRDIPLGSRWLEKIDSALSSSSVFVILCSPASLPRSWINFEAGCAWMKRVPLIPLCHSGIKKGELPTPISIFEAFELESADWIDDFFESLKNHFKISSYARIDKLVMAKELKQALGSVALTSSLAQRATREDNRPPISDADALNLIESWMGSRPSGVNRKAIRYSDVDSQLNLTHGTAKRLIEAAAQRYGYVTRRKGEDTILFEEGPSTLGVKGSWNYVE